MHSDKFWNRVIGMEIGDGRADGDFETGDVSGECRLLLIDLSRVSMGVFCDNKNKHKCLIGRVKTTEVLWLAELTYPYSAPVKIGP